MLGAGVIPHGTCRGGTCEKIWTQYKRAPVDGLFNEMLGGASIDHIARPQIDQIAAVTVFSRVVNPQVMGERTLHWILESSRMSKMNISSGRA